MIRAYLQRYYGDQIAFIYADIAQPGVEEQFQAELRSVPAGYLMYPLVFVNSELVSAGNLEYYVVFQAVREVVEANRVA